ncbi:hypothetical protein [Thermoflavimicrobium daqui]|jgi:hypothetical protein|uniref:hypothetical protein n=1 Tax=Thermoflavimicrobium daqui TaxID=2137476 RepID=UPI00143D629E|nr:hypothetical protein [Thermoflavimicrobium daqui]
MDRLSALLALALAKSFNRKAHSIETCLEIGHGEWDWIDSFPSDDHPMNPF